MFLKTYTGKLWNVASCHHRCVFDSFKRLSNVQPHHRPPQQGAYGIPPFARSQQQSLDSSHKSPQQASDDIQYIRLDFSKNVPACTLTFRKLVWCTDLSPLTAKAYVSVPRASAEHQHSFQGENGKEWMPEQYIRLSRMNWVIVERGTWNWTYK